MKEVFPVRVVIHWLMLPRDVQGATSLETFQVRLFGGSEQTSLVADVPAYCRQLGLGDL